MDKELAQEQVARLHGVQRAMGDGAGSGNAPTPPRWSEAEPRLVAYLRACGVTDDRHLAEFGNAVKRRLLMRHPLRREDDPVAVAIRELMFVIDDWIAEELGVSRYHERGRILAARAAMFAGETPGWEALCINGVHGGFATALRKTLIEAVPPKAGRTMRQQSIPLPYLRLRARLRRWFRRLKGGANRAPGLES